MAPARGSHRSPLPARPPHPTHKSVRPVYWPAWGPAALSPLITEKLVVFFPKDLSVAL